MSLSISLTFSSTSSFFSQTFTSHHYPHTTHTSQALLLCLLLYMGMCKVGFLLHIIQFIFISSISSQCSPCYIGISLCSHSCFCFLLFLSKNHARTTQERVFVCMCGVTCFLVGQWGALCVDDLVGLVASTLEAIAECLEVMRDTCCVTAVVWV